MTMRVRYDGGLHCSIRDDGVGFDPKAVFSGKAGTGVGLLGMRERVRLLGGAFSVISNPGECAEILVKLPSVKCSAAIM